MSVVNNISLRWFDDGSCVGRKAITQFYIAIVATSFAVRNCGSTIYRNSICVVIPRKKIYIMV